MFEVWVAGLEGTVEVIVKPFKNKRSQNQNKYYWGVVIKELVVKLNADNEEIHSAMKQLFLSTVIRLGTLEIPTVRSTASLNTEEMEEYMSKIRQWASATPEVALYIPLPNEIDWLKDY